jgi:hypothetical protein
MVLRYTSKLSPKIPRKDKPCLAIHIPHRTKEHQNIEHMQEVEYMQIMNQSSLYD